MPDEGGKGNAFEVFSKPLTPAPLPSGERGSERVLLPLALFGRGGWGVRVLLEGGAVGLPLFEDELAEVGLVGGIWWGDEFELFFACEV